MAKSDEQMLEDELGIKIPMWYPKQFEFLKYRPNFSNETQDIRVTEN